MFSVKMIFFNNSHYKEKLNNIVTSAQNNDWKQAQTLYNDVNKSWKTVSFLLVIFYNANLKLSVVIRIKGYRKIITKASTTAIIKILHYLFFS